MSCQEPVPSAEIHEIITDESLTLDSIVCTAEPVAPFTLPMALKTQYHIDPIACGFGESLQYFLTVVSKNKSTNFQK